MRFAVISPTAGLQKFATLSKTHLVLAHVDNPMYWQFYRRRSEEGDLVILDNGAYEGKMDAELLTLRTVDLKPKVVALPDELGAETLSSYTLSMSYYLKFRSRLPFDWLFIPQAKTQRDRPQVTYVIQKAIESGIKWFGIPRFFATDLKWSRADICHEIRMLGGPETYMHAFGMAAGSVSELEELRNAGCDSIDSSAPVWRGWQGYELEDLEWNITGSDCDFNAHPNTLTVAAERLIKANLRKVGIKC